MILQQCKERNRRSHGNCRCCKLKDQTNGDLMLCQSFQNCQGTVHQLEPLHS